MKKIYLTVFLSIILLSSIFSQTAKVKMVRVDDKQKVDVIVDGKFFTSYQYPSNLEKPFLSPIYAPSGSVITRGFPLEARKGERVDHPHHIGLWFNHGNVNGLDFWNNSSAIPKDKKSEYGHIFVRSIDKVKGGKTGILKVTSEWKDINEMTLLIEKTTYIFSGDKNTRTVDHISTLTAANGKVTISDNKEGMFAIRVDRAFEMPSNESLVFTDEKGNPTTVKATDNTGVTGMYVASSGLKGEKVWGTRNEWVLLSGTKDNVLTTFGIFDHPKNPGYPAYSHARGYGLFSMNNLGQNSYDPKQEKVVYNLEEGESITLCHRFFIQSGSEITTDEAKGIAADFAKKY
ncbi:MAG TPA: PmoA family protein [Bacteroidales bacterium]|nr:PmoA family protein [Bacteroidales bacterium]